MSRHGLCVLLLCPQIPSGPRPDSASIRSRIPISNSLKEGMHAAYVYNADQDEAVKQAPSLSARRRVEESMDVLVSEVPV